MNNDLDNFIPAYNKYQLYDEAYLKNLDSAKNNLISPDSNGFADINEYNPTYKKSQLLKNYNRENAKNKYTIPQKSVSKYFSAAQLYNNGDGKHYKLLENFKRDGGGVSVHSSHYKPIDPISIFNTSKWKYNAHFETTGILKCETKGRSYEMRLSSSPENIQEQTQTNTATANAIGMSQDYNFFTGVGSRAISFTFVVYADYLPSPYQDVISYCRDLKQMNYPTYSSSTTNSPSVTFIYGGLTITGIPNINITFGDTVRNGKIDKATVSVNITETTKITGGEVLGYN